MNIIATRYGKTFLVLTDGEYGHMVDYAKGRVSPRMNVHSALLRGYWTTPDIDTDRDEQIMQMVRLSERVSL